LGKDGKKIFVRYIKKSIKIMKNFKTYKDFKVDESVTRSKEKFSVIVKNTGEIIDDGLPKDLALKLAAKKNGWVIKKVDKSITEKFMDSQIDQIAQAEFGMDYDQLGKGEKEWVRDEIDNMTESVNEGSRKKVTKSMWQKMSDDEKENALLTVFEDPDTAQKWIERKWNSLPGSVARDMYTESVTEAKAEPIVDLLDQGKWANVGMGEKKLVKLSDAFDTIGDEQADAIASHLNMAIELMQEREKKSAVPHMNKFNKACEQELKLMKKQGLAESVNEADINKLHKPFVDDIYKAVGVIDKILSKNKPPKVPTDIWSKLYGLAGDMTEWADELLTLKESVNEAAPRITNSKETEALLELRDRVANSSKGGSSRYSKEFDKAKTTALRAIEQMLTYTKIGV